MNGCNRCGRLDASLRGASYMYAISFVLGAYSDGVGSGDYCRRCRRTLAGGWSLLTLLVGPWSIPGPIYTIRAIGYNLGGGFQKADYNANLLRTVARQLIERGDKREAAAALKESLKYREDPDLHELLWHLTGEALEPTATATAVHSPGELVRCLTDGEPLRSAPGALHEPVGTLVDDAVVTRADGSWIEVRVLRGGTGWVPANAVEARA